MELHENVYQQAFEDFLRNDAERGITEATLHRDEGHGMWVILFEDGRYALEHYFTPDPERMAASAVAVPVEPLKEAEFAPEAPENSAFERAIDTMWQHLRSQLKTLL